MQDIAVIGIANIFPGSTAPEDFWQQLLAKQDCRSKASAVQMGAEVAKYQGNKGDTDKFYCVHGGYINDFNFQPTLFCDNHSGLTEEYLTQLDDLQHWSLYVMQQALHDAGYWRSDQLASCGLILGNLSFPTKSSNHLFMPLYHQVVDDTLSEIVDADFQLSAFSAGQNSVKEQGHYELSQKIPHKNADTIHADNALVAGYPAALLAKAAGLGGAHFALDAACASSCYSVKIACDYLHTGKANMMLAGAVSAADPMFVNMGFSIFQAFPENNIHAPFDKHSQGLFAGEGAGMMVLKRHSDAVRDGDKIHAIIKGGALSNDGKGEFVLSPNTKGQVLAYERAYENAGVNPAEVDYIECHATGTPKGDNVELSSMETFFSRYTLNDADKPLLGSVKSNVGHLLTAAGMPGMTKAIWALNTGKIPATINLTAPLSSKKGYFTGAHMPTETCDWPIKSTNVDTSGTSDSSDKSDKSDNANNQTKAELPHDKPCTNKPRIAGVSVFGFGGANAHLVLQAPTQHVNSVKEPVYKPQPLAIVGMDAHFGHAHNLAAFEQLLTTNATTFRPLPEQRWKGIENNQAVMQALNFKQPPMGGYVDSFEIDFLRFKVPPNEQDSLIPQQLMMMKVADNAAKDANLTPGSNVAVLVAMGMELALHQYRGRVNLTTQIEQSLLQQGVTLTPEQQQTLTNIAKDGVDFSAQLNQYTSFIGNIMASRISALWDFSGPAITVSAEENSVYRCVELAQSLCQTSDVEAVIIASVDLSGSIENITLRQHYGELDCRLLPQQLAAEKISHTALFNSQQWQVGEGAAAFVVKRADDSLLNASPNSNLNQSQDKQAKHQQTQHRKTQDRQEKNTQVNNTLQGDKQLTGSQSVYAIINSVAFVNDTSSQAITKAASQALAQAQLTASDITQVEAHASGFINENKAEGEALPRLYNTSTMSSVKRHIGHTFNASGAASIIKTALALSAEKQPKWHAINGLGKDGSCAHLILGAVNNADKVNDSKVSASKVDTTHAPIKHSGVLPAKKYQLKKTISLGGHNIRETMLLASQSSVNKQHISQIKTTFDKRALLPVTNNTNGIDLTLIKPRFNPSGSIPADNSLNTNINTNINTNTLDNRHLDNAFTFSSGVSVKQPSASNSVIEQQRPHAMQNNSTTKNTSAIDNTSAKNNTSAIPRQVTQQAATHQAFLTQRQQAQAQIATLLTLQLNAELNANIANKIGEGPLSSPTKQFRQTSTSQESILQASTSQVSVTKEEQSIVEAEQLSVPEGFAIKGPKGYAYPPLALRKRFNQANNIIWDTADLVEFAEGDIAKVFGDDYKIIDSYSRRVRLPTTDYLLVSRVTALEAELHAYKKSYMCTEYDIPVDAPFLIDGQIPWSVSVESGQCDLLLIAFIGIDFQAQGERVYRLLDCELTFLEDMAFGGETLRYEIHIDSYAKNGEQLLFFFHYDCYVGDKKVLIMRNGCAGFFTDEELHDGKGVILNDSDKAQLTQAEKSVFTPLMQRHRDIYHYADMMKLVNGDLAGCFGQGYDQQGRNPSLKFSSAKFLMIERITNINSSGGHWGLGLIEGQKELAPEHWYFPCHFKDDQVMAGSLMSEGCGQMAMFYMLSLGMHKYVNNARFQPVPGESQTVRCRGQVLPQTNTLTYRMEVTDIGMHPYPFLKANIDIILDGKVVVDFKNLSVMIKEQDQQSRYPVSLPDNAVLYNKDHNNSEPGSISRDSGHTSNNKSSDNKFSDSLSEQNKPLAQDEPDERGLTPFKHLQRPLMKVVSDFSAPSNKGVIPIKHFMAPMLVGQNRIPDKAPFSPWHLFEFATGNIANCFGADFDVYQGRIPPRTPCGDLQVVTQVVEVKGKRLDFNDPASCVAEYFVPEDAWYFTHNSHQAWMPYSLIMEIALQPNGFISGYMGTTLAYPEKDLFFRNLDGSGELVKQLDLRGKTIVNKSTLLSTTMAGGMIVQSFTFALYAIETGLSDKCNAHDDLAVEALFYQGTAVFGYFAEAALTNQLGIDNGKTTTPWFVEHKTAKADIISLDLRNKNLPLYQAPQGKPHYKLAGGKMNFIDKVSIVEGGGSAGIAYVYGERCIDASDWFFRYHFHQDPVMPGSLGVEAIIELLQTYALHNNLGAAFDNPRFIAPTTSVKWKYRGQITPLNKQMSLDIHITNIVKSADEVRLVGEANLSKDGLRIYQVSDLVLSIVEA